MRTSRGCLVGIAVVALGCGASDALDAIQGNGDTGVEEVAQATGFQPLYDDYLKQCANCHAPGAPGRTSLTEATLDFTSATTAKATLHGQASGLSGNQESCNGVAFLGATYAASLLAATLDETVRASFSQGSGCNSAAVSDMVQKTGTQPPAGFLAALQAWIDGGAQ